MNFDTQPKDTQIVQTGESSWQIFAPAKINLNLLVGSVREDNFHPVDSVVSKITLYDTINLSVINRAGVGEIKFSCAGFDAGCDADNLVVQAAKLGLELATTQNKQAVDLEISLEKNIPMGAGLGGGSSDAAAILKWFVEFYNLQISQEQLYQQAATLGSDVPLFLAGVSSRMTGRGEIIKPTELPDFYALLCMPNLHCPTGPVYNAYDQAPIEITDQRTCVDWNKPCDKWGRQLFNDLRKPAFKVIPELENISANLQSATNQPVLLTGSGSSLFVLYSNLDQATQDLKILPEHLKSKTVIISKNSW